MTTEIVSPSRACLEKAKRIICSGGVVAFHTETVYGLGANAFDDNAVQKIFSLKGRPADNPLIVHVHPDFHISPLVDYIPQYAERLRKEFPIGPLTLVYPSMGKVSGSVSCGLDTLAIRVPSSPTAQAFLKEVDLPIAAPSANKSKRVSPVTAEHVYDDFKGEIPLILDGGTCTGGIESTVLDCTGEYPVILREGLITQEMIASICGKCGVYERKAGEKPKSPGMAYKHYAPRCRTLYFTKEGRAEAIEAYSKEASAGAKPCFLAETNQAENLKKEGYFVLDLGAGGEQMAQNLYGLLRRAEREYTLLICIEPTLRGGVMAGVMNRLSRAFGRENSQEEGK